MLAKTLWSPSWGTIECTGGAAPMPIACLSLSMLDYQVLSLSLITRLVSRVSLHVSFTALCSCLPISLCASLNSSQLGLGPGPDHTYVNPLHPYSVPCPDPCGSHTRSHLTPTLPRSTWLPQEITIFAKLQKPAAWQFGGPDRACDAGGVEQYIPRKVLRVGPRPWSRLRGGTCMASQTGRSRGSPTHGAPVTVAPGVEEGYCYSFQVQRKGCFGEESHATDAEAPYEPEAPCVAELGYLQV